jgi:hypothetical protein
VLWSAAGLIYLLARLVFLAARPPAKRHVPLASVVPAWVVLIAAGTLLVIQFAFPLYSFRPVIDVGYASVAGAERIIDGQDLYGASGYTNPGLHPDTYGPLNYLAYVPFAYAFSQAGHAARAAADVFDLLTVVGLFFLGRRLIAGTAGTRLGATLAYSWCAYPYTFFVTVYGYNDALVALLLVGAMLVLSSFGRGAFLGLATGVKFVPIVAAPLFATWRWDRTLRSLLLYTFSFVTAAVVVFIPFVPDGGLAELYDRTVGWQLHRESLLSIWGQFPSLDWLHQLVRAGAATFAIIIAVVPRRKTPFQVAALAAASIIAFELSLAHWLPSYVVWFAPLALVAMLGSERVTARPTKAPSASIQ